ncbi:MAG: hypothetical protein DBX44_02970 [Oscillospiraceae bacterium]|nr:MAG: hypothetical protein DBX44_02970 [Oscillospiraceae bacterium]
MAYFPPKISFLFPYGGTLHTTAENEGMDGGAPDKKVTTSQADQKTDAQTKPVCYGNVAFRAE